MARTKGSKCRKTLARELGIDLDTYIRLEKEGKLEEFRNEVLGIQTKIEEENREGNVEIIVVSEENNDTKTDSKAAEIDSEAKDKSEQNKNKIMKPKKNKSKVEKIIDSELDVVEDKNKNKVKDTKIESEAENKTSETPLTSSTKPVITPKTKIMVPSDKKDFERDKQNIRVGRNENESEVESEIKTENKVAKKSNTDKSSKVIARNSILCSRCHKAILKDSSHRIKLENLVPGIAEYRYNLKDDIWLCHDCAVGLSKWIEDFLDNEGEGCERKFGVVDGGEVEG